MSLSFVVIGRNEENNIFRCIKSVFNFIKLNEILDFEIIYVDSDSSDNSLKIVSDFENVVLVKIQGEINAAIARNVGANFSTKEYIFFIDGDMEIMSDFYKEVIIDNQFVYDFISGDYLGYYYENGAIVDIKSYYNLENDIKQSTTGGVFIIKKSLWDKVLGMRVKYRRCQDLDFGLRLSEIGFPLLRKKQIIAIHHTVSYYDNSRLWIDLFNGNQLYQKSVLYRDHIFNFNIFPFLFREISMLGLILSIVFCVLLFNFQFIIFYFLLLAVKSIYKFQNGVSKNFFVRFGYYFLLDVSCLIGLFIFWPKNTRNFKIQNLNE